MGWEDILKTQFADAGYKPMSDNEMDRQDAAWGDSQSVEQKIEEFANRALKPMYDREDDRIKRDFPNQRGTTRALGGFEKPTQEVTEDFYDLVEEAGEELFLQVVNKVLNVPKSRIVPKGGSSHLLLANYSD
tara:strand:- start:465 stop:860 length:396 start_codon:yes stop_codon:yes gene_type:complete